MTVEELVTGLYGPKAVTQLNRSKRGDYRPYLKRDWQTLTRAEQEALAYGLYLHGTTNDIVWAWECWAKQQAAVAPAARRSEAPGRWEL